MAQIVREKLQRGEQEQKLRRREFEQELQRREQAQEQRLLRREQELQRREQELQNREQELRRREQELQHQEQEKKLQHRQQEQELQLREEEVSRKEADIRQVAVIQRLAYVFQDVTRYKRFLCCPTSQAQIILDFFQAVSVKAVFSRPVHPHPLSGFSVLRHLTKY
jgi:hypothetical protein